MKRKKIQHFLCLILLIFGIGYPLRAELIGNPSLGYTLDLPEGFRLVNSRENARYVYQNTIIPVGLQVALYPYQQFGTVAAAADHIFSQLKAQKKAIQFLMQGNPALVANLQFTQQNQKQAGWLLVQPLAEQSGWLVILTTTQAEKAQEYEPMMISSLDAVFTGRQSFFEPGPMIQAVYPKEGTIKKEVLFNGKKLSVHFDRSDSEANQAVIDREFALLTRYLNSPLQQKAWQRYYRMIYRDSIARCRHLSLMLEKELIEVGQEGKMPAAETIAASLLEWMQGFTYTRDENGADFLNIPSVCTGQSGDCDSRALLMSVILQHFNIDSILMIAPEQKHAVAAVDCPGDGARFTHNGKRYLIAETTAKVALGQIAQDLADPGLWFAVDWYTPPDQDEYGFGKAE
ncbi:hypothetical protein HMPREF1222_02239 [Treponema vincentii F0403]|uniref:Transglutaminase-like domain-containing protein n=1 Tax=Treponema vincentii F0403 TaxID=1125702 RepID=S3L896_9SPIR|nr:hypothetical protein [Treponema vincentii]EPF45950.1 hypothetical protein HMPREF1222_02239 [Treponema vincentii F0403]